MKKVLIIHFQPLEKYPPVMNMLNYLAGINDAKAEIHVITSMADSHTVLFARDGIKIHRLANWSADASGLKRGVQYLKFYLQSLTLALKLKPATIFYYETLSAFVPWLLMKIFGRKFRLFIHYHEYSSKQDYKNGMLLGRWFHSLEKSIYQSAQWISQTNGYRNELFAKDLGFTNPTILRELPNYPPAEWRKRMQIRINENAFCRFVYVGALSLETTYLREMLQFVIANKERCSWDIYTDNATDAARDFIMRNGDETVKLKGPVLYTGLPALLPSYDIGVILYKGHIQNYVYNAPNKLFEYMACGLNVWFPSEVTGCREFITAGSLPEVAEVDFNAGFAQYPPLKKRIQNFHPAESGYFADKAYNEIGNLLLN